MYYSFIGLSNGSYQYSVTLKLFQRCGSNRLFPDPAIISVFNKTTATRVRDITVPITNQEQISITEPNPCITNPPSVCYDVAYYQFIISLPASSLGFVLASQVNYRINGINNLTVGSSNVGATYIADIPGNNSISSAPENNSATFTGSDLVVVCANNDFTYSFAAVDSDGDALRYLFCEAYASTNAGGNTQPTNPPPFPPVPYQNPFNETAPLGPDVQINPITGLITGVAPTSGTYVVTVCVQEVRNGVVIASQRKDIQINIADCNIAAATLLPEYQLCKNSQTITISNLSSSPLIMTSDWEFIDNTNTVIHNTTGPTVTFTFPAIGLYKVKLLINRGQPCTDSTIALVRVFPGFVPNFNTSGTCITKPTFFTDNTSSVYGIPDSWKWDFGEPSTNQDISIQQNPSYTYPALGIKNVRLIASDTRGCLDTIFKSLAIIDKPPINLSFRDTLICIKDNLQLQANGSGNFTWSPVINIMNANTATPTVSPAVTTTYYVELDDNGCLNRDSVKVNVVNFVSLQVMGDTIICRTDSVQLVTNSNGLQFTWTPASLLIKPTVKSPFAITNNPLTNYQVTAVIGGCSATDNVTVTTIPYPIVSAGADFSICYNTNAQLNGNTNGSSWQWSPAGLLNNPALLNPVSYPPQTTNFILTAFDTKGCPKPGRDTVLLTVLPKINISAGRDTAVIVNQSLQFNGSGGINYEWFPATFLSAADVADPIGIFSNPSDGLVYKLIAYNPQGCKDSASITVKVFKTPPIVFVPTAFTPNNDGRNDLLRPLSAGILNIDYFNIYNRWGQLLFTTQTNGKGWDGKINGVLQTSGTFVWTVKATDYTGKAYFEKGTVTIIR